MKIKENMLSIEKIDENNRQWAVGQLRRDVIRHVFAFYDLQYDLKNTTMYAAVENGMLRGYILVYQALEFPSVVLEADPEASKRLIEHAPTGNFIMHAPADLLPEIEDKFPNAKHYVENWMRIKKGEAKLFRSENVRKLDPADGSKLAALLSSRLDRPEGAAEKYSDWIRRMQMYGVFGDGELVAYAGSFIQTPQVWMIGGVYTHPQYRNRGYATLATSAITEEALGKSDSAALFARQDNYWAIRAYEKIGYRKIGERIWIDVGTGIKP
jgi:RimJ/RimL family protein N-acetyltransferase